MPKSNKKTKKTTTKRIVELSCFDTPFQYSSLVLMKKKPFCLQPALFNMGLVFHRSRLLSSVKISM